MLCIDCCGIDVKIDELELWLAARERSEARSEECEERGAAAARRSRAELKFFLSKAELCPLLILINQDCL